MCIRDRSSPAGPRRFEYQAIAWLRKGDEVRGIKARSAAPLLSISPAAASLAAGTRVTANPALSSWD